MTNLEIALSTETLKLRRSRTPWLTAAGFSLAPLIGGLFMLVLQEPEWGRRAGLLTTKAQIAAAAADWPTYLGILVQAVAVGGFLGFGIVATWVFGREFSDRSAKDMLALPTPRAAIVLAKFVIVGVWCMLLTLLVVGLGLAIGGMIGLPGWSGEMARDRLLDVASAAILTLLLVTPIALVASTGRGYMAPLGTMVVVLMLAQVFAATGWGVYFPWAVPGLGSGVAGPEAPEVGVFSYLLVVLVGGGGILATVAWWHLTDHT